MKFFLIFLFWKKRKKIVLSNKIYTLVMHIKWTSIIMYKSFLNVVFLIILMSRCNSTERESRNCKRKTMPTNLHCRCSVYDLSIFRQWAPNYCCLQLLLCWRGVHPLLCWWNCNLYWDLKGAIDSWLRCDHLKFAT